MIDLFQALNEEDAALMLDAIPLITVLIAGADGNIDEDEKEWGAKLTKIRSYSFPERLNDYYSEIGKNYSERVEALIQELPDDVDARNSAISDRMTPMNDILAKMDQADAYGVYNSFTSFAEHVAKSSGGFLRIGAISRAEKVWINLPMLTPIEAPVADDESEEA